MPADPVEAGKWLQLAASQGLTTAEERWELLRGRLTPEELAECEARVREWTPAQASP